VSGISGHVRLGHGHPVCIAFPRAQYASFRFSRSRRKEAHVRDMTSGGTSNTKYEIRLSEMGRLGSLSRLVEGQA